MEVQAIVDKFEGELKDGLKVVAVDAMAAGGSLDLVVDLLCAKIGSVGVDLEPVVKPLLFKLLEGLVK